MAQPSAQSPIDAFGRTRPPPSHPAVGSVLAGRYHLDQLIAVGGAGAVFRATDSYLHQLVAIKVLTLKQWDGGSAAVQKILDDLRSEARASILLSHPNIVRTYNYERDLSWEFLVMEYVQGSDLARHRMSLPERALPIAKVIDIGVAACYALEHARQKGVPHLDIKPANILISLSGEVKICDFGLAALTALIARGDPGHVIAGTPAYMSPEMISQQRADHRADVYSLAATLYDAATGGPPFGRDPKSCLRAHLQDAVPPNLRLPDDLWLVLKRGLAKDPEIRFQTPGAFGEALDALRRGPRKAHADSTHEVDPVDVNFELSETGAEPVALASGLKVESFRYDLIKKQWSVPSLPALDSERTLVLAFGAPELIDAPAPLLELSQAYPSSLVIGCSSSGEIFGTEVLDHSLSVAVTKFQKTQLSTSTVEVRDAKESFTAGEALGRNLSRPDLRAVLVLSEGLKVNGSELVRGLNSALDESVVVTGGLSGDGTRFKETWVYSQGKARSGTVVAVGLYGDHLVVGHGSKGGWDKFGPERTVTRAEGNVLYELDGTPALTLYKQYLGDKASGLPATGLLFPLSLRSSVTDEKYLVRTLLAVDEAKGSLTFAGDVPTGHLVQLMKANFDRLVEGASDAATVSKGRLDVAPGSPCLAVAISCVGRRLVLGERTEEEVEAVEGALPPGTKIAGFYSYGELSPFATGKCDLHNQTMTLTVLSESANPVERRAPLAPPVENSRPSSVPATKVVASGASGLMVESFRYDATTKQWSVSSLPALDSERTLVLAFGAPEVVDVPEALAELSRNYPRSVVIGCSSAGEIFGTEVLDHSLSVAVAKFQKTTLASASVEVNDAKQSFAAGEALGRKLSRPDLRGVLVLSEGLKVNGSELVRGFNSVLDESVVVTGGLSGDGTRFQQTWVYARGKAKSGTVVAVGLYGDHVVLGHGSKGGWDKFGPERTVTRSEGNVLYELDGTPALALYKQYLGDQASGLPATGLLFPLSLRKGPTDDKYLVRTLLSVDEAKGSMTFAGDVPSGHLVQLMKANFDRLVEGASEAAAVSRGRLQVAPGSPCLAVAISCVGRRLVLGERTEEEVEAVQEALPPGTTIAGFYSYGELSPFAAGKCDLHNQTMTLTVISESSTPLPRRASLASPRIEPKSKPPPPPALELLQTSGASGINEVSAAKKAAAAVFEEARVLTGEDAALCVELREHEGVKIVSFRGRMSESFRAREVASSLNGTVLLDLKGVERITSFGVREWLQMLKDASGHLAELYLGRCSEAVVNQLSMIRSFAGDGRVASFVAPYRCEGCGNSFLKLLDCERDAPSIREKRAPAAQCPKCKRDATFDDEPLSYFAFAANHVGVPIPAAVRRCLELLEDQGAGAGHEEQDAIEKTVDGQTTKFRIRGALTEGLRWGRVLDGLEGHVRLDFGAVTKVAPLALTHLVQALGSVEAESLVLEACPRPVLERLVLSDRLPAVIGSVLLEGRCGKCQTSRAALIDVQKERGTISAGRDPRVACKRCNGPLEFSDAKVLLEFAAKTGGELPAPGVAAGVPSVLPEAPASPYPPDRSQLSLPIWVLAGALLVLGAFVVGRELTQVATPIEAAPSVVIQPAAAPAPAPAAPEPIELPPPWTERPTTLEAGALWVVGKGGPSATPEAALEDARAQAIDRVLGEALRRLSGTPVFDYVQTELSRSRHFETLEGQRATARRYLGTYGQLATPERAEVWSKKAGSPQELFARYKLPEAALDALVAELGAFRQVRGVGVAAFFPRLEAADPGAPAVVVVRVDEKSRAAASGLRPGDGVVSVNRRLIASLADFEKIIQDEWARLPPGGNLKAEIRARGVVRTVELARRRGP